MAILPIHLLRFDDVETAIFPVHFLRFDDAEEVVLDRSAWRLAISVSEP